MKLYHGSHSYVNPIELRKSTFRLDFGSGFYTTPDQAQAEDWAFKKSYRYRALPTVTVMDYVLNPNLSFNLFNEFNLDWAEFIWKQKFLQKGHSFDIVEGPCITGTALQYAKGQSQFFDDCDLQKLLSLAQKQDKQIWQLAFCTQAAINCLTVKVHESYIITPKHTRYNFNSQYSQEDINNINAIISRTVQFLAQHLIQDYDITEDRALNQVYSSQTYKNITNIPLEFWGECDNFIYQTLQKELNGEKV